MLTQGVHHRTVGINPRQDIGRKLGSDHDVPALQVHEGYQKFLYASQRGHHLLFHGIRRHWPAAWISLLAPLPEKEKQGKIRSSPVEDRSIDTIEKIK